MKLNIRLIYIILSLTLIQTIDEFIFSQKNINFIKYLKDLPLNISCVKITQKKFKDRFLIEEKYITQNYSCINKEIGFEWAPKNIVRTNDFIDIQNIHMINVKNNILYVSNNCSKCCSKEKS